MSSAIYLIVEDDNDGKVVQAILKTKGFHQVRVNVRQPSGQRGGVSRLAAQLEALIQTAMKEKGERDCIAVLHDADELVVPPPDRQPYKRIASICQQYDVKLVVVRDELEAWLLADAGLRTWLGVKPENWDERQKPSYELDRLLRQKKMKYQGRDRSRVLDHVDGSGDALSKSMEDALKHLEDTPCIEVFPAT